MRGQSSPGFFSKRIAARFPRHRRQPVPQSQTGAAAASQVLELAVHYEFNKLSFGKCDLRDVGKSCYRGFQVLWERLGGEFVQCDRLFNPEISDRLAFEGRHNRARTLRLAQIAAGGARTCRCRIQYESERSGYSYRRSASR